MRRLRREIFLPTALLGGVIAAALAFLGWESMREARALEREANEVRATTSIVLALSDAEQDEERGLAGLVFRPDPLHHARIAEAGRTVTRLSMQMGERPLPPRAQEVWRRFVLTRSALRPLIDEVIAAARSKDPAAIAVATDKWHLMNIRADRLLSDISAYHLNRLDRTMAELQRRRAHALAGAALAFAFGLLVAVGFAALLARAVVRPIVDMAEAARRIEATGTAEPVAGADRADEIGVLARAFNAMTARLLSANATLAAANARLGEAVRARDEFISIASHELKTPLTPLALRVQQLLRLASAGEEGPVSRERVAHSTRNLDAHVTKLARLVESLLDVSRINSGQLVLRVEPVPLARVIEEAVERVAAELAAARCPVRVEGPDVVVRCDRVRLEQVLVNLLGNAAKYAPGAPVGIRVAPAGDDVVVEVTDAGPGIAPADQARIFERFERAPADRHVSGLGLGLYIAREIVHAHGGELSVRSAPGAGTTFAVRLRKEG